MVSRLAVVPSTPSQAGDARDLGLALGLSHTAARLLWNMGHTDAQLARAFLEPRLSQLTPPDPMADRTVAAKRLANAIRNGERICVFGDYDCDGITSAAIVVHALRRLGADAEVVLANRYEGGYGVSLRALDRIRETRPKLLVTCDCGSSDAENLGILASEGLETIVIDHHLVPDDPLPAIAFLNPHRPDCGFQYKSLASCGLALSLMAALRAELKANLDLHTYLDLVAIGTIADVAPLDGDNRVLVRAGLQRIGEGARPGIKALLDRARIERGVAISAEDVAFRIAPRLNAPGRLGSPMISLRLLLAEDTASAERLADEIEDLQRERRSLQDKMLAEALAEIELQGWDNDAGIVIGRDTWTSGIVGILAGKLSEHFRRPVVAIGFEGDCGHGSVRGPRGTPLYDILKGLADCLVRFGGHQAAAGLDVRSENVGELRRRFNGACAAHCAVAANKEMLNDREVVPLDCEDDVLQVARDLSLFEPCGEGNRQPLLLAKGQVVRARAVRGGHLQVVIETQSGQTLRAFGFGLGADADALAGELGIVGTLRVSRYQSVDRAEIRIERLSPSERAPGTVREHA
jgi:single-stranded-DNA-specific exonuclease